MGKPRLRARLDALWVRVGVEALAAEETDESDSCLLGELHRQARGGGNGGDDRNAGEHGLLHDLEREAAGDEEDGRRLEAATQKRPDRLVRRVVAPDIFSREDERPIRGEEAGRMEAPVDAKTA